ncbi:MAG: hypothetical protein V3T08_01450 [Gemmatimonadota bacterium]
MKRKILVAALISALGAVTLASNCDEVTTVTSTDQVTVVISVSSPIIATGDTLARDTVQFAVELIQGSDTASAVGRFSSDDPTIVEIIDENTGEATFTGLGAATISVEVDDASLSGSLTASMRVPVDSFLIAITASSASLAAGDTLVGDTVVYDVILTKAVSGQVVPAVGKVFSSSADSIISFLANDDTTAVLTGPGQAVVSVRFDEPLIPGAGSQPLSGTRLTMNVVDFSAFLEVDSRQGNFTQNGDTLVSDSVTIIAKVVIGGDTSDVVDPVLSSSDMSVIQTFGSDGAVFADTGTATVTVRFTDPVVPEQQVSLPIRVTTFLVNVGGPASPVMGDTAQYTVTVTDTKPDPDTAVSVTGQDFVSSNGPVLPILDAATGEAFARDIGQADVRVTFTQPTLPNAMLEGSLSVDITEERFYGTALPDSGAFGDTVRLTATAVHTFTDSTRVSFINGAAGYVDSVGPTQLRFVVGAGNDSTAPAPLTLVNLLDEGALPRDTVDTKFNFKGLGGIDDAFEPNDTLPLNAGLEITALPFVQLLSSDPRKMAPADTNFFYIDATSSAITVDIIAEWQQDANLDFFVCNGDANPPTTQVAGCARDPGLNDQDPPTVRSKEEEISLMLGPAIHIIAFYCVDCPATVPLTYRVTIQ